MNKDDGLAPEDTGTGLLNHNGIVILAPKWSSYYLGVYRPQSPHPRFSQNTNLHVCSQGNTSLRVPIRASKHADEC